MIQINPLKSYIDGGVRAALTTPPSASLVFDLPGKAIWVKGVKLKGIDHTYTFNHDNYITLTNTPDKNNPESEDIKIGVNITTLKNVIDTTYNGGTLALLQEGLNTEERTWLAKILHNYINNVLPVTKNLKINGTNYAIYTTADSLPLFFVPVSLGTTGQILACTSSGLIWVDLIQNTDYRVSLSSATSNSNYRIILKQGADNNPETDFVRFSEYLTFNPYTKTLKINNIKVVTATDIYVGSNAGLVPTATSAQLNYYLRGDGAWVNIATEMAAANTWRPIKVENTDALGSGTNTGTLSFIAGTGITLSWDATNKRIIITNSSPDINHNTDETVRQVPKTDDVNRPLMMINGSTSAGEQINTSMFSTGIYANASTKMITANGFIKAGSSDNYVLLGGGNHKAISDFAPSSHSHNYAAREDYGGFTKSGRLPISGFYQSNESESGGNAPWSSWMHLINCLHSNTSNNYALLIAASFFDNNIFKIRVTENNVNNTWRDIIHSGNIGSQTVANAYHLRINSANTWSTWYWSGLSGLPSWLWGSNDGSNMYVWNPSNFSVNYASSAGNADTLDGYHANSGNNSTPYGRIPVIEPDGVMEVGKYIDFHYDNSGKYDFSTRLQASGNYVNWVNLPSANGTLALTSQIPNVTDYYWANVPISATSNSNTSPTFARPISIYSLFTNGSEIIGYVGRGGSNDNLYFGNYKNADVNIFTNSNTSNCIYLKSGGNVGIGITNPAYTLDVVGNIRMSSHLYASTANMTGAILKVYDEGNNYGLKVVLGSGGTTLIGAGESADVLANYYTDENLYLSADGNVNIFTNLDGGWDYRRHVACFANDGNTYIYGGLHIGSSPSNNYIAFYGNTGDDPGSYQTSFIGEHLWAESESTELLLMKFNDVGNGIDGVTAYSSGPDRIRHLAHAHVFQIMTDTTQGDFVTMANSSAVETKFDIARYQLHAYAPLAIISDSTNSGYDGLVYMRHYSNNDWGLIVDKSQSYTYGVDIRAGGDYALKVGNGNTRLIGATIIGADATPSYTLDVRGHIRATENLIVSTNNTTGGGIIFADDGDIVDLNDAFCTMRFTSGIRITNANRGGNVVHELNANGKLYNYGLYHHSYGSYDYLLTSNGDARHINSLPYTPWKELWIDMTGYSESYWHPVVTQLPYSGYKRIKVTVQLNSGTKPSWSTHSSGFTCNLDLWVTAHGWGTTSSETICLNSTYAFTDQNPVGWCQLGNSSLGILLLRGGGRYLVYTDWDTSWTIHNQSITDRAGTLYLQTCGPYTSWPGIFNGSTNKNWIYAHTRGNIITDDWLSIRDYAGSYHGKSNNISGYAGEIWFGGNFHIDSQNGQNLYLNYYTSAFISLALGGGRVGVGTDSPSYKLHISGDCGATNFYSTSDIRYKKVLSNIKINIYELAQIPLFNFKWIDNRDNLLHSGTSALSVEKILPNIVSSKNPDQLHLDYAILGTIAGITACKELVTLKSELLQLKEKVKLLEDKLRKYENTL